MSDRKPRPQRPYRGPTAKPYGPPRKMTRDELKAAAEDAWKVLPPVKIALSIGDFRCPDPRCGEDKIPMLVPHPKDETQTANRCPTCLATAAGLGSSEPR